MRSIKSFSQYDIKLSLSVEELQGKQSVRATFRLSDHTIKLLHIVAFQLGLKQKSLFDQLFEDEGTVKEIAGRKLKQDAQIDFCQRKSKTYEMTGLHCCFSDKNLR